MYTNSKLLSVFEHLAKLMTRQLESQDEINKNTCGYVFWKMYPGNGRQRGIG